MTAQQMVDWFDTLQDKYGSPYFTDTEKLLFLNRSQFEYVKSLFPDNEGGTINIEKDWNNLQNVNTLVFELPEDTMDSSGRISRSDITTNLRTVSGDVNCDVFKILSVEFKRGSDRFPCKFLRHNDKGEFERNYFKKPDFGSPRVLFQNSVLQFRPIDTVVKIFITAVKTPKAIALSPASNSELPEDTHNQIVALALEFAGVASRDEVLTQMNSAQLTR